MLGALSIDQVQSLLIAIVLAAGVGILILIVIGACIWSGRAEDQAVRMEQIHRERHHE